jgi:glutamyl-tRNA reductase
MAKTYAAVPARKVAFLGLGVMGYPMAGHLARAGHSVTVYNRTATKAAQWVAEYGGGPNATSAATPAAAAADALEDEAAAEEAQFPPSAVPPFDRLLHRAAHAVLRLAIIVMADFAA